MRKFDCKEYQEWVENGETFRDCKLGFMSEDGLCDECKKCDIKVTVHNDIKLCICNCVKGLCK